MNYIFIKVSGSEIADGAPPPGKNGRERIVRLLIRGVITRQIILGIEPHEFLPTLMDFISQTIHSSLRATPDDERRLISYFSTESQRFSKTVECGRRQLVKCLKENGGGTLSGPQIVCLEKKLGLPYFLTATVLREKGLAFAGAECKVALASWNQTSHSNSLN